MNILICDDEAVFVQTVSEAVQSYFSAHDVAHTIYAYTNSAEIPIRDVRFDMAFLDIEMQEKSGIALASELLAHSPKTLIFMITSHNRYLDDAMDLHVFRFLQKPLNVSRLDAGLDKAMQIIHEAEIPVFIRNGHETVRIFSDELVYVEIDGRRTKAVTTAQTYLCEVPIREWLQKLPRNIFFMVHGSYIINVRFVTQYSREQVTLKGGHTVPISYRRQPAFRRFFAEFCRDMA